MLLPPFASRRGAGWTARLPPDALAEPPERRTAMALWEDNRRLGPGNAMEADICALGRGRYAVWPNEVCFSSSDGTNPNTNGRRYSLLLRSILKSALAEGPTGRPRRRRRTAEMTWVPPSGRFAARCWGPARGASASPAASPDWLGSNFAGWWTNQRIGSVVPRAPAQSEIELATDAERAITDPGVDAVFITVPDFLHRPLATAAFAAGKHVFLEKPVATTLADGWAIIEAWRNSGRVLQLGYVLRAAPFYRELRRVLADGLIGRIHTIQLTDHLGVMHGATYMRRWHRHSANSGGLMVHKGCHDLDLVCWLLDTQPTRVSSFGGLFTFNRPAPARYCSQCPEQGICDYRDVAAYEDRTPAERADPEPLRPRPLRFCRRQGHRRQPGRRVRVVEWRPRLLHLGSAEPTGSQRRISVLGEMGKLEGDFEQARIEVSINAGPPESWTVRDAKNGGHGGGDTRILRDFLDACLGRCEPELRTAEDAMRGLVFALAAEKARLSDGPAVVSRDLKIID